jgi:hypothetical protein
VKTEQVWDASLVGVADHPLYVPGKDLLLNVMFHGTSAITTWYLGLIDKAGYTALAAGDRQSVPSRFGRNSSGKLAKAMWFTMMIPASRSWS